MEHLSCHRLLSLCQSEGGVKTLDLQSTPDNSNLQGKSKKFELGNKQIDGEGM